ncbi:hypothetical protein WA171_000480, partial [Blastocystis sp. BT1]
MFWNDHPRRDDTEVTKYLHALDALSQKTNSTTIRSLISAILEWSLDCDSSEEIQLIRKFQTMISSQSDSFAYELLPYIFHCLEVDDPELTCESTQLLNSIIQSSTSVVLISSIYNTLHTIYSTHAFQVRKSIASFIPSLYNQFVHLQSSSSFQPITTNTLVELRTIYFNLCEDSRLLVRREASRQLLDCYQAFGDSHFSKFLTLLKAFLNDDDSIRIIVLPYIPSLLPHCSDPSHIGTLLHLYKEALISRSLRVQEAAVRILQEVGDCLPIDDFCSSLLDSVISLARESYPTIRLIVLKHLLWVQQTIPDSLFMEKFFPYLESFITENDVSMSEAITPLVVSLMKTHRDETQPLFDQLLQKQHDGVRMFCLQHYDSAIHSDSAIEFLILSRDLSRCIWRIREAIALAIDSLLQAAQSTQSLHIARLIDLYISLFGDPISAVRKACTDSIQNVIEVMGPEYVISRILPEVRTLYETAGYLVKGNLLMMLQNVLLSPSMIPFQDVFIQDKRIIIDELSNSIPNMRFIACRVISNTYNLFPEEYRRDYILPKLHSMARDEDGDVQFYSALALKTVVAS